ncbi:hypothetical protein B0F90DRAFT_1814340 [Multifurca ochricompacta]|uniref:Uncharacterized protein n=1 Tax=Multifurca ochricompacta TaxID=376703 RepID=A0AAD4M9S1_9AGAM|nr:hypothetical protein B0F90DRAFT_1814340 [Multifurca ochricompacta]
MAINVFKRSSLNQYSQFRKFGQSIVPQKQATSSPYLNIKLPDLSAPPLEPEIHIPFTPDFWESSRAKAEAVPTLPEDSLVPKVIVVAGDSSRADSTHISEPVQEHVSVEHHVEPSSTPKVSNLRSLFLDIADDVILPKDLNVFKANRHQQALLNDLIEETSTSIGKSEFHTRTLDKDEVRGVWILLGLFAGSWLAGGLLKKESKFAELE